MNKFTDLRGVGSLRTIQEKRGKGQLLLDVLGKVGPHNYLHRL